MQNSTFVSTQEFLSYWTGMVTVVCTVMAAGFGILSRSFSSRSTALKSEGTAKASEETIAALERSADWARRAAHGSTAAAAVFGCFSWWFSSNVTELKEEARSRFERESNFKIEAAKEGTVKALAEAANAEARAAKANEKAAQAGEGTAKALAEAAAATERTRKLGLESDELRVRAARAERELIEVQERVQPRRFTNAEQARVLQALEAVPKGPVIIEAHLGDGEGQMLAGQIREILKVSGWLNVKSTNSASFGNRTGVSIEYRDLPSVAVPLADALSGKQFLVEASRNPQGPEGVVMIIVGMKPDP